MKKGFLDGYKTYDTSNGFGGKHQWREAFSDRMGFEEAKKILSEREQSPEQILGITGIYTFKHLQYYYRKRIFDCHPDRGGSTEEAQRVIAAYTILKRAFGE